MSENEQEPVDRFRDMLDDYANMVYEAGQGLSCPGMDDCRERLVDWVKDVSAPPSRDKVEGLVEELNSAAIDMGFRFRDYGMSMTAEKYQLVVASQERYGRAYSALAALSTTKEEGRG